MPVFLTLGDVIEIHAYQLDQYGEPNEPRGVIDRGVVESSTFMAQQSFGGEFLHTDIAHMAAAYLFHFAANQGFEQGNKRVGAATCIRFLNLNGYDLDLEWEAIYDMTMQVANHETDKDHVAAWIREHIISAE